MTRATLTADADCDECSGSGVVVRRVQNETEKRRPCRCVSAMPFGHIDHNGKRTPFASPVKMKWGRTGPTADPLDLRADRGITVRVRDEVSAWPPLGFFTRSPWKCVPVQVDHEATRREGYMRAMGEVQRAFNDSPDDSDTEVQAVLASIPDELEHYGTGAALELPEVDLQKGPRRADNGRIEPLAMATAVAQSKAPTVAEVCAEKARREGYTRAMAEVLAAYREAGDTDAAERRAMYETIPQSIRGTFVDQGACLPAVKL